MLLLTARSLILVDSLHETLRRLLSPASSAATDRAVSTSSLVQAAATYHMRHISNCPGIPSLQTKERGHTSVQHSRQLSDISPEPDAAQIPKELFCFHHTGSGTLTARGRGGRRKGMHSTRTGRSKSGWGMGHATHCVSQQFRD
jgi:hypothetical protein